MRAGICALVHSIAIAIVDDVSEVSVAIDARDATIIQLRVSSHDLEKITGKTGQVAHAIQTVIAAISMKSGQRFRLQFLASGKG